MSCWGRGEALCPATFRGGPVQRPAFADVNSPESHEIFHRGQRNQQIPQSPCLRAKVVFNSLNLGWNDTKCPAAFRVQVHNHNRMIGMGERSSIDDENERVIRTLRSQ